MYSQPPDHLVKAAFIYKVAQFTSWTQQPELAEGAPLTLCTFGSDDVAASLPKLEGRAVGGHRLHVVAVREVAANCAIAYLAESERSRWPQLLTALHQLGALTALDGGMVLEDSGAVLELATVKDRVVFGVNMERARAAGLSISAKVLRLASQVFAL